MDQRLKCKTQNNIRKIRWETIDWEKIFAEDICHKELLFKIYKELLKTVRKQQSDEKWAKDFNRYFTKEDI